MQKTLLLFGLLTAAGCAQQPSENQQQSALGEVAAKSEGNPASVSPAVRKGPFGLAMGQPVAELKFVNTSDSDPTQARALESVPRPMTELELYAVVAYPQTGICEIRTVSKTFDSDAYGVNVKAAIDALSDSLDAKYGKHEKSSFCSSGGSCQFFQMGLKDGSQGYSYTWSKSTGANLPADVAEVSLSAMPGEYNDTFYRLDYTSSDREGCQKAKRTAKAAAL